MVQLVALLQQSKGILEWILESAGALNLLAFVGVFIAWYLNRRNDKEKIEYEERKQLKKILFVMLEIRKRIVLDQRIKIISKSYTKAIVSEISKMTGDSLDAESQNEMNIVLIEPLFKQMFDDVTVNDDEIEKKFDDCINKLSEINPILCFEINGKQNVRKFLTTWTDTSFDHFKEQLDLKEINFNQAEKLLTDKVNLDLANGVIEYFDEMVVDIAHLISRKTEKDVVALLDDREDENEVEKEFKEKFQEILTFLKSNTPELPSES